ncbi:MAG: hypothetical protein ABFD16_03260 [Thermoguttaceae bacterium]
MNRALLGVLVSATIVFGLTTAGWAQPPRQLRVATFSSDVTPPIDGHPLIWIVPAKTIETPLLAKGIVLDDGQNRYVLCAVDWCGLCNSSHRLFRSKIAAAAGTDISRVAVQTVHQHTAPYTDGDTQKLLDQEKNPPRYVDFKFLDEITDRLAVAVRASLDRLQPFDRIGTGQAKVERVASCRRVVTPEGKHVTRWSSCKDPALIALPEGPIDPFVKTITLAQGDKPLVRLHYYATHPQTFYNDPRVSGDMPAFARERLEKKDHVFQIYFTGCSGNVTLGKYNNGTPEARDELTERLYEGMEASVAATKYAPANELAWRSVPLVLSARTDPGYTVEERRAKMADPKVNATLRVRAATSVAFAQRSSQPLDLCRLQIGRVQILCLPGECMIEYQHYAQQQRPDDFVAVAAYGDLGTGYICTAKAFAEGGYEPTASHTGPETEPLLKAAIRQLLGARASDR